MSAPSPKERRIATVRAALATVGIDLVTATGNAERAIGEWERHVLDMERLSMLKRDLESTLARIEQEGDL